MYNTISRPNGQSIVRLFVYSPVRLSVCSLYHIFFAGDHDWAHAILFALQNTVDKSFDNYHFLLDYLFPLALIDPSMFLFSSFISGPEEANNLIIHQKIVFMKFENRPSFTKKQGQHL